MSKNDTSIIKNILNRVDSNKIGIFSKTPEPIVILNNRISKIVGDNTVYITEFIIAKIKGKIITNKGHPEITDDIFCSIPQTLNTPHGIYLDNRVIDRTKYLFVNFSPPHHIVIEIRRIETGKTEINSIIPLGRKTLKQLENKFQAVYSHLY